MIYQPRTFILAYTVYSTTGVLALLDRRVLITYSYTSLSSGTGLNSVKVSQPA